MAVGYWIGLLYSSTNGASPSNRRRGSPLYSSTKTPSGSHPTPTSEGQQLKLLSLSTPSSSHPRYIPTKPIGLLPLCEASASWQSKALAYSSQEVALSSSIATTPELCLSTHNHYQQFLTHKRQLVQQENRDLNALAVAHAVGAPFP